jgi:hypothetical protein
MKLAIGENPTDEGISATKDILRASEYVGTKVVKFRVFTFKVRGFLPPEEPPFATVVPVPNEEYLESWENIVS